LKTGGRVEWFNLIYSNTIGWLFPSTGDVFAVIVESSENRK
jgi:hypothetical protein